MNNRILAWLRHFRFQRFWESLHRRSLVGLNYWSSHFDWTGERDAIEYVAERLRSIQHPVIFDVGANVGDFSAFCAAAFGENSIIHAFEPSHQTFDLLQKTLCDFPNVVFHKVGFSDRARRETLYSSEPGSTIASVHQLERPIRPFRHEFSECIQLLTIDGFCRREKVAHIDFLKLDIEGHEYMALQGAAEMIARGKIRFIQFEFGENNVSSRTFLADFARFLEPRYKIYRVVPNGIVPWTYEGGRSEIFATMNYLCELATEERAGAIDRN